MAKDPIFPLYYNDIDRSTKTWTDEEFGAYMRLLMEQWDKGGLPKDYQRLTRIATSLDRNWPLLKDKFQEVDGQLKNMVLEEVRAKRAKHKQKQKENIDKRYQKPTKHDTKILPLEKENEIEKENETKIENDFSPNDQITDWEYWGKKIVDGEDQYWEQMKGRKITTEELDIFLSVASRNDWAMETQQKFRTALKGFKSNSQTIIQNGNQRKNTNSAELIDPNKKYVGKL